MVFAREYNQLINNDFRIINKLSVYSKDITNQRFGNLVAIIPLMSLHRSKYNTIYWICRCDCGNYYRVLANRLYYNKITCCPECNAGVVTKNNKIIHPINNTARKTDNELINQLVDDFYIYFKNIIELEDFKQELHCIFATNRFKNKSRTWCMQYYLRDLLCRLRGYYKKPIYYTFDSYDNMEIIVENIFDYLDIYPIDKKLNTYINKCLTKNEQKVIYYIYWYRLSIIKIGKIMNLSKQRISQLHLNALKKLKNKCKKE